MASQESEDSSFGNVFVRRYGRENNDIKCNKISALNQARHCYENPVDIHGHPLTNHLRNSVMCNRSTNLKTVIVQRRSTVPDS